MVVPRWKGWKMPGTRRAAALFALLALPLVLAACGSLAASGGAKPGAATQKSEAGQVTVAVTWQGTSAGPTFRVALDTHAVELDGYDLRELATLRIDGGRELQPSVWDAPKGGHHREGNLTFPATFSDGGAAIGPSTRSIELVIRDVAGVPERAFRWTP